MQSETATFCGVTQSKAERSGHPKETASLHGYVKGDASQQRLPRHHVSKWRSCD
jgi:hypothetical protein